MWRVVRRVTHADQNDEDVSLSARIREPNAVSQRLVRAYGRCLKLYRKVLKVDQHKRRRLCIDRQFMRGHFKLLDMS